MARIRTIKPGFFKHGELYDAEHESGLPLRIAFAGMWGVADREGRFRWKPREIKTEVLPYDDVSMVAVMEALAKAGFLVKYSTPDGKECGFIPGFAAHQHINKNEPVSALPAPPKDVAKTDSAPDRTSSVSADTDQAPSDDDANTIVAPSPHPQEGKGKERKGKDLSAEADIPAFDDFWKKYPTDKNMGKKEARDVWSRLSPEKRTAAVTAIPGFLTYCRANSWYRPIHACRFLSKERFESYDAEPEMDQATIEANKDRADRVMRRGKYAEQMQ